MNESLLFIRFVGVSSMNKGNALRLVLKRMARGRNVYNDGSLFEKCLIEYYTYYKSSYKCGSAS